MTALLMRLLRAEPEERPTMAEARDALAAVANGQAAPAFTPAVVSPTHPPSWRGAPIQQPQPAATRSLTPPSPPPATRVDLHTPPRPTRRSTNRRRTTHRPAAAPQYSQRPKGRDRLHRPAKNKKSTVYTALAIVAAAVIGIMFASMISNNDDGRRRTTRAQHDHPEDPGRRPNPASKPPKSAEKAGQWTRSPLSRRGAAERLLRQAPSRLRTPGRWATRTSRAAPGGYAGSSTSGRG